MPTAQKRQRRPKDLEIREGYALCPQVRLGIGSISDPCFSVLLHTKPVIHLRHILAGHGVARLGSGRAGGQGQFLFSRGDQGHELRHFDVMPARRLPSISAQRGTQL